MAQVLSQDEVDALLQGVTSASINTGAVRDGGSDKAGFNAPVGVRPYDFSKSEISARGCLPGVEVIFNNFDRRLQSMFATELGKSVDANFDGMEETSYERLSQRF